MSDLWVLGGGYFLIKSFSSFESGHPITGCFALLLAIGCGAVSMMTFSQGG